MKADVRFCQRENMATRTGCTRRTGPHRRRSGLRRRDEGEGTVVSRVEGRGASYGSCNDLPELETAERANRLALQRQLLGSVGG